VEGVMSDHDPYSDLALSFFLNPENSIPERLARVYSENELVEKAL
jgi:hypothetical protein